MLLCMTNGEKPGTLSAERGTTIHSRTLCSNSANSSWCLVTIAADPWISPSSQNWCSLEREKAFAGDHSISAFFTKFWPGPKWLASDILAVKGASKGHFGG